MDLNKPYRGFGKDINDYLNHYISMTDGKATAVATVSLAVVGLAIGAIDKSCAGFFGAFFATLAVIAAGWCIFPKTPSSGNGHIFWSDIKNYKSATEYWKSLSALDSESIEFEYAKQNFFVSEVLIKKMTAIRISMAFLALASVATSIAYGTV